jgi:heterodisulfide reductase subunit A-like polyferredoxin
MSEETIGAVLVCGAGITGIQAALDLADSGFKVYLLDSAPAIGGRMSQLDKTFPTGDCAMCILSPRLVEVARNRNIEIITLADVQGVSGRPGSFKVKIRQQPRYVDLKKCDACSDCAAVCPVELPNEFDCGLSKRKAIFRPYPQAIPNVFGISKSQGPAPCKGSCPAGVNVQGYIALTAAGKLKEAYDLIRRRCPLPSVCGRVCNHPCEDNCNRNGIDEAISARDIERFVADYIDANPDQYPAWTSAGTSVNARVAVIGSGPAGLTAAADLALAGYRVTLCEAQPLLGGMLRYGIPDYRLPKNVLEKEIRQILKLGVQVRSGVAIDRPKDLLKSKTRQAAGSAQGEFDAVLVATGAWGTRKMNIPCEDASGVWEGLKFLTEVNAKQFPKIGPEVLVIGGGDMAMDAARCALRLPGVKSVSVACIENREEMPARPWHVAEALEEGVAFYHRLGTTRIEAPGGKAASVVFRACTSVFDEYRKFDPLYDDSAITSLQADTVILAMNQGVQSSGFGLELRPGGRIRADASQSTSVAGIFAAGDAVLGPSSVVDSIAQGHKAAESIDAFIRGAAYIRNTAAVVHAAGSLANPAKPVFAKNPVPGAPSRKRVSFPRLSAGARTESFAEIAAGYIKEQAAKEAARCLSCGLCSECMQCVQACTAGAVLHEQQASEFDLDVGSIILAPGIEEFPAGRWEEYGHGRFNNVLSNIQFERMLSAGGPTGGKVQRLSDGGAARKIAFIQCVGSRNAERGNDSCSSVCCMSAAKEAMAAMEHAKNKPEVSIFCTDLCASGKEFDKYMSRARDEFGIRFVRALPSRVEEMPDTKNPRICYISQSGAEQQQEFDLVVLSSGIQAPSEAKKMAGRLGLELNEFGFARTNRLSPLAASQPGIYVAGAFQEPKDISESVVQASAAAAAAMEQLTSVRGTMIQRHEYPWERDVADEIPRIGVFVCHCGHNISSVVDVERIARKAAAMPGVRHAEANIYTCSESNQQHIKEMIRKHRLNRLVIASCWSRTHEVLFQETLRESGLNQYLLAITNIRDQCSWVHRDDPAAATEKAIDLVSMAVARARHLKALRNGEVPVTASALILGGGIAGMTAALNIAGQGYKVHLVEKESALGGNAARLHRTLEADDVQSRIQGLISKVLSNASITVHLNSKLTSIAGQVGNFNSVVNAAGLEKTIEHGAVIVATGGQEQPTQKYLNGKNPRVLTQSKLESLLADGQAQQLKEKPNPSFVMIQCVESRDKKHPYCSRMCCSEALKNALEIKKQMPRSEVAILYRDIRTPGFRDAFYRKAREQGVQFIRRPESQEPEIVEEGGQIKVKVRDAATGRDLVLRPDLLVLSTGIAPCPDNSAISGMLRSALNSDGFFQEAHSKLRPVDLSNEGEFLCGLAHSPRFIDETIAQAQGAAGRAARILSKAELEIAGQVAHVNPANCVACATCVKVCPYGAPVINDVRKSEIQGAKCMGCGSCVAVCPAKTITLQHQDSRIVTAMLDELLVGGGFV